MTREPLVRIPARASARFPHIVSVCHSVLSLSSPLALSRQVADVASRNRIFALPSKSLSSGSAPRLPSKKTLFIEFDIFGFLRVGVGFQPGESASGAPKSESQSFPELRAENGQRTAGAAAGDPAPRHPTSAQAFCTCSR